MIDNKEKTREPCLLGRMVDETTGKPKEPSHCIIQYGGRVRLPDKLMEILNKDFAPDVIWWQPDGECFAFDSGEVQEKILDVWFRGTKLSSFIRSLNRWGFRRVFYHALPVSALAFHHSSFGKESSPEMLKSMKMSKSGSKASQAVAAAAKAQVSAPSPVVPSPSTSLTQSLSMASDVAATPNTMSRLTQLSELAGLSSAALPLSNTNTAEQELLLKILSEQRNRQLLAIANSAGLPTSVSNATSVDDASFLRCLLVAHQQQEQHQQQQRQDMATNSSDHQQQLHLLLQELLVKQELANRQREQQRESEQRRDAAIHMAILTLNNARQGGGSGTGGQGML